MLAFETHATGNGARIYRPSFRENKPNTGSLNLATGVF
jgi:hypothetical protein